MTPDQAEYLSNRTLEQLEELASEYDCELLVADDNVLQIDLDDDDEGVEVFWRQVDILIHNGVWPGGRIEMWRSKSGKGRHAVVELREPMELRDRILLQALLGSDIKREALAYMREEKGTENPLVLFRPLKAAPVTFTGDYSVAGLLEIE